VLAGERGGLRAYLALAGPAVIASIAYMDPGNFATNIQAGAKYGYSLCQIPSTEVGLRPSRRIRAIPDPVDRKQATNRDRASPWPLRTRHTSPHSLQARE
jgi:hypothetical protein